MRRILSPLWLSALAALFPSLTLGASLAMGGTRTVAAWPAQGTIEQAAELSAPAHRAPEAPRLQSDLGRGQGGARHDRAPIGFLPERPSSLVSRLSFLGSSFVVLRASAASTSRGAPLFPTGPPARVS